MLRLGISKYICKARKWISTNLTAMGRTAAQQFLAVYFKPIDFVGPADPPFEINRADLLHLQIYFKSKDGFKVAPSSLSVLLWVYVLPRNKWRSRLFFEVILSRVSAYTNYRLCLCIPTVRVGFVDNLEFDEAHGGYVAGAGTKVAAPFSPLHLALQVQPTGGRA